MADVTAYLPTVAVTRGSNSHIGPTVSGTSPYVDLNLVHRPSAAPANSPPPAWAEQVRSNMEFLAKRPSVCVRRDSLSTVGSSGQFLPWNSADLWDSHGFHDPAVNNTRITIPTGLSGLYLVNVYITWDSFSGGQWRQIALQNQTPATIADHVMPPTGWLRTPVTWLVPLYAGQYYEVFISHSDSTSHSMYPPVGAETQGVTAVFQWVSVLP